MVTNNGSNKQALTATVNGIDPLTIPLQALPDESINIETLMQRTGEMLETLLRANGSRFPWGAKSGVLYEKQLEGRAFAVVSSPLFVEIEDVFNKGQTKTIARLMVRRYNPDTRELLPAQEARLQGGYVMSQLRGLTDRELVGAWLWTLARDENDSPYQRGDGWEYPRKLAIYDVTTDTPVDATLDQSWSDAVDGLARQVAQMAEDGITIHPAPTTLAPTSKNPRK